VLPPKRWWRIAEIARLTPYSVRTLRRWCARGDIRASKLLGGVWYVDTRRLRTEIVRRGESSQLAEMLSQLASASRR